MRRHTIIRFLLMIVLLGAMAFLASCGESSAGASPAGWTIYHDQMFPFQLPIPPHWHVNVQTNAQCDHTVEILPPGAAAPVGPIGAERIAVRVLAGCPEWRGTLDDAAEVQAGSTTIFGAKATVYNNSSDPGWTNRTAVAHFGGHQYVFNVQAPASKVRQDVALYEHMLQGFQYQGS